MLAKCQKKFSALTSHKFPIDNLYLAYSLGPLN